jgi:hypothetical protein
MLLRLLKTGFLARSTTLHARFGHSREQFVLFLSAVLGCGEKVAHVYKTSGSV